LAKPVKNKKTHASVPLRFWAYFRKKFDSALWKLVHNERKLNINFIQKLFSSAK
jgi:hypothetical protein